MKSPACAQCSFIVYLLVFMCFRGRWAISFNFLSWTMSRSVVVSACLNVSVDFFCSARCYLISVTNLIIFARNWRRKEKKRGHGQYLQCSILGSEIPPRLWYHGWNIHPFLQIETQWSLNEHYRKNQALAANGRSTSFAIPGTLFFFLRIVVLYLQVMKSFETALQTQQFKEKRQTRKKARRQPHGDQH